MYLFKKIYCESIMQQYFNLQHTGTTCFYESMVLILILLGPIEDVAILGKL